MLRLCLLNSVAPKLRTNTEGLVSQKRNWFSDGYRLSAPGTNICRRDTDCEAGEICQGGYCTGFRRFLNTRGLFNDDEYRHILMDPRPYPFLRYTLAKNYPDRQFYKHIKSGHINFPLRDVLIEEGDPHDYDNDYAY